MDLLHQLGYTLGGGLPPPPVPVPLGSVWERHSNLQLVCMVLSIFFWFFSFTAAFSAITISRWRYSGHKRSLSSRMSKDEAPGVTIIRPLRGLDCNMYENLASSFRQDYPKFELIFSVAHKTDPAVAVVRDLISQFPNVDARLIIGDRNIGINPKINNMVQAYEEAKYDIVWVYDSNVYVDPGCMGRSVDKMLQPGVGLVHHLPFGVRPQTLGSELELMFLDTVHAKMYLFINWTGLASCVVGKSCLYRRSDLDKVGGLAAFGKYMAEDNLIATAIFNMGYKHEMTSDLAYQSLGSMTPSDYFLRRARWTRIRKYTVTAATVVEPFIEMIGCGLVASYGFNLLWQTHFLNFLAFHVVIWFLVDLSMYQALSGEKMDNLRGFLMAWCLRELAALPLYAYAVLGSTVDWRDQTFVLLRSGTVRPLNPSSSTSSTSSRKLSIKPVSTSSSSPSSSSSSSPVSVRPIETPPLSPTSSAAFWSKVATPSTQATLRKFLRHPVVISIVSSTFAVVHFVVDILIKSQRNGNDEEPLDSAISEDEQEDDEESVSEKPIVTKKRSLNSRLNKSKKYLSNDSQYDDESAAENDVVLRRSARLKSQMLSRTGSSLKIQGDKVETEYGRRSIEEDELSRAVEPYLSDSLSRRGRTRRELSSSSSRFL